MTTRACRHIAPGQPPFWSMNSCRRWKSRSRARRSTTTTIRMTWGPPSISYWQSHCACERALYHTFRSDTLRRLPRPEIEHASGSSRPLAFCIQGTHRCPSHDRTYAPSPRPRTQFSLTFEVQLGRRYTGRDGSEARHAAHSFRRGMLPGVLALGFEARELVEPNLAPTSASDRPCTDADHGRRRLGRSQKISPLRVSLIESIGLSGEIRPTLSEFEKHELALWNGRGVSGLDALLRLCSESIAVDHKSATKIRVGTKTQTGHRTASDCDGANRQSASLVSPCKYCGIPLDPCPGNSPR
jgi:hypothetical protein